MHPVRKGQQHRLLHGTRQIPLLTGKGRVAVIHLQRFQHRIVALAVQLQPVAVLTAAALQNTQRCICCCQILAGGHGFAQVEHAFRLRIIGSGYDKISARFVLVQLRIRQLGLQILGKQLHAHHAVYRAVR